MSLTSKIGTAVWFLRRPLFWSHAVELARRKLAPNYDSPSRRAKATGWAAGKAVRIDEALVAVGLLKKHQKIPRLAPTILDDAKRAASGAPTLMGGAGDLDLIYAAARLSCASRAIETGVACGWSSLAILSAITDNGGGHLISVDMPYPKMDNERFVGIVIPQSLRASWTLLRLPDRSGLKRAIAHFNSKVDFAHYDSDKSYYGRRFAYPLIWRALTPGGVFISDDVEDNMGFREFVTARKLPFAVTECNGKYVGLCRKPR